MITVRKARIKDLPTLGTLEQELLKNQLEILKKHRPVIHKDFRLKKDAKKTYMKFARGCIYSRNALILLAEDDGKPIGYLTVIIRKNVPIFRLERVAEITDLYLREGYRALGISTMLRDECFAWLKSKKVKRVGLNMFPDNKLAAVVYEHWGFEPNLLDLRTDVK